MSLAVCLVSGGMDSCVSLALALEQGFEPAALHVSYGQRTAEREAMAYQTIADHYAIPARLRLKTAIASLKSIGGSSLTDCAIPVSEANLDATDIPTSYVPFRNAHFLAIATSWAEVIGAKAIVIGAVDEDSSGYPDCRLAYFQAFDEVIRLGTARGDIHILTPVIALSKAQIVREGIRLGAPLHLTWSCYQSEGLACGRCDSCALRLRGFAQAGADDPIPYSR